VVHQRPHEQFEHPGAQARLPLGRPRTGFSGYQAVTSDKSQQQRDEPEELLGRVDLLRQDHVEAVVRVVH
jgi:hypothetical protein